MKNIYTINMYGYGGEVVMGFVKPEIYQYFQDNNIDLTEFRFLDDDKTNIPDEFIPFRPSQWYDCNDLIQNYGVEMSKGCFIEVSDQSGNLLFKSDLDIDALETIGIVTKCTGDFHSENYPKGSIIFFGQEFEKGQFFNEKIEINSIFDHKKLRMEYVSAQGFITLERIFYENKEIYNENGSDIYPKSETYEFLISENEFKRQYS